MGILFDTLLYYLGGSAVAGTLMGLGFATNLAGRADPSAIRALERSGTYIPLTLDGIEGGLLAMPNERRPAIVYVHGRSANWTEMEPLARALFSAGYNAVLWDSRSRQIRYGPEEIARIRKVIASVRNDPHVDPRRVYVLGFSLGAAMAIGAAAFDADRHIRGVIADSSYADLSTAASHYLTGFGVIPKVVAWPWRKVTFWTAGALHGIDFQKRNPADWAPQVQCPVLLIHGRADRRVPPQHSETIFDRLSSTKELWLVEDAGHTKAYRKKTADYLERVLAFLSRHSAPIPFTALPIR
jgi:hypothetical protein